MAKELKGKNDYETVKNIHDYLVLNIAYQDNGSDGAHTVYNALMNGKCVCDGYTKSFYFICMASGIDADIVMGYGHNKSGTEAHSWNKVRIGERWFSIDVTWDDPYPDTPGEVQYNYFLLTDEDMGRTHTWDDTGYVKADSKKYGLVYKELEKANTFTDKNKLSNWLDTTIKDAEEKINAARKSGKGKKEYEFTVYADMDEAIATGIVKEALNASNKRGFGYELSWISAGAFGTKYTFNIIRN